MDLDTTQMFQFGANRDDFIKNIVMEVYSALLEKGIQPNQPNGGIYSVR